MVHKGCNGRPRHGAARSAPAPRHRVTASSKPAARRAAEPEPAEARAAARRTGGPGRLKPY
ncbi:hypothetical protein E2C01_031090 [Portunus trituberculatus]|uniref:Uncharacterized protein n=1 Tax=Portunus trituberculatus TaxID=210409 RepID=A0A5B7EXN1_PORTR|nr:hypothetical protein [Portunus trituberculatus]